MKKWIKNFIILLYLLAVTIVTGVYDSHAAGNNVSGPEVTPVRGMFASLGLTDDQKAQMKGIFEKNRPTLQPLVQQYRAQKQQLRKLIHTAPVDDAAIRAQAAQTSVTEGDLAVQRAHLIREILDLLTPEQIQKLSEKGDDAAAAKIDRFMCRMTRHRAKG